jgi:hypothetical protein
MRGTPEPVLSNSSVLLGAYSDLLSGASTRDRQYILGGPVVDYDPPAILAIPPDAGAGLYRIDTTCWNATLNDFYVSAESLELSLLP